MSTEGMLLCLCSENKEIMITTEEKQRARMKDHESLSIAKEKDRKKKLVPFLVCKNPPTMVLVPKNADADYLQRVINRHTKDGRIKINEIN